MQGKQQNRNVPERKGKNKIEESGMGNVMRRRKRRGRRQGKADEKGIYSEEVREEERRQS